MATEFPMPTHGLFQDWRGRRFGRLTVIRYAGQKSEWGGHYWLCRCDCGNETTVFSTALRSGSIKSCRCLARELSSRRAKTHGHAIRETPTYRAWSGAKNRCRNPNNVGFHRYGGRGISFCDRWLEFVNFLEDMGERPSAKHSIDRWPDNNGNYEPGNCRWATAKEQIRNRRNTVFVELNGERMTLAEAAERYKVSYNLVKDRVVDGEWPVLEALTRPKGMYFWR